MKRSSLQKEEVNLHQKSFMRSTPVEHNSQGAFALVIFYTSYIVIGLPETQLEPLLFVSRHSR